MVGEDQFIMERVSPMGRNSEGSFTQDAEVDVRDDPDPDAFEGWLLERSLSSAGSGSGDEEFRASGPIRAMALEILAEWRLAELPGAFRSWLTEGAPSDDAERG